MTEKLTESELLAAVMAEIAADILPPLEPGCEVTPRMVMQIYGCTYGRAKELLEEKVRTGKMTKRDAMHEGRRVTAYRPVAQDG